MKTLRQYSKCNSNLNKSTMELRQVKTMKQETMLKRAVGNNEI